MSAPTVVILAAGQGTRMKSALPKVLHPICGRPMVAWPIQAALEAGASAVVVVGGPDRALADHLPPGTTLAVQPQADGTGGAVRAATDQIDAGATVIVLAGDVPLVTADLIMRLARAHADAGAAATVVTMELEDPGGYGRIVRAPDGSVERVVETKEPGDASERELAITEVNTGIFAFNGAALLTGLAEVRADNAQGEYYLPDVLAILRAGGATVAAHRVEDHTIAMGVNDRSALADVTALAQRRIHDRHMRAGVTIVDPASTLIDVDVQIGADTVIEPSSFLRGSTRVGVNCVVGPLSTLIDTTLGDAVVVPHSYLVQALVRDGASVGPFAYLRPGALLRERSKVGTFVEIKNSDIGVGTKVPHLSYIGDADIGEGSNLGAGTITANYDGRSKHRTTIGAGVRGGVDTAFVAPVQIGDGAWTAAGSVVTENVPAEALAIARSRQRNVEGFGKRVTDDEKPGPGE